MGPLIGVQRITFSNKTQNKSSVVLSLDFLQCNQNLYIKQPIASIYYDFFHIFHSHLANILQWLSFIESFQKSQLNIKGVLPT